jgi:lipoate-protein ligase B
MAMRRIDLGGVPYPEALESMAGWVEERRAGIRGGITSHGFALNVDPDLTVFDRFTAGRLGDVEMTSLRRLADTAGRTLPPEPIIRDTLAAHLGAASVRS